ncbi:helix-turn-helix domain-containing protein [Algoriphagus chordae]|uniref:Helix-turn-helix protein n=1 Tax=Algoriphagus chordae TaxID=237019 RepID=A0A2W7QLL7_9BACT|nr:helix-turn-helix transcriptional regulator [Algoriphagus chordae]PZX49343.1 helix-turn-helix protein [Algoriphagus chordae]
MKQPELGKKISELRKLKGLTQEQLVEMCNLNVRTIQRLEAGEVSPRNHTVKAIFEALEIDWVEAGKAEHQEKIEEEKSSEVNSIVKKAVPNLILLYLALAAGVINLILLFFESGLDVNPMKVDEVNVSTFWWVKAGVALLSTLFLAGMIKMTHIFPNRILRRTLWVMLIINAIFGSVELALGTELNLVILGFYIIRSIVFGSFFVLIGIGFLSYKNVWSNYTQIIGVLGVLSGVLIMSVIGAYFVSVPFTLFKLSQLGFLFWGITKIERTSSPDSTFSSQVTA